MIKLDADNANCVWRFVPWALSQMGLHRLANSAMCREIGERGPAWAGDMAWGAVAAWVEDMVWDAVAGWGWAVVVGGGAAVG